MVEDHRNILGMFNKCTMYKTNKINQCTNKYTRYKRERAENEKLKR